MTSGKRTWILLLGIAALSNACSSSGDSGSGSGGSGSSETGGKGSTNETGGTSGGSGGSGGTETGGGAGMSSSTGGKGGTMNGDLCQNTGDINDDCPPKDPLTGACAPKGVCCHRSANSVKEKALASDATFTELEYRINYALTVNHDKTIGELKVATLSIARSDNEEQSDLVRMKMPRKDGKDIAGMGEFTRYVGRYNCNGTYSFYDDSAAPTTKDTPAGLSDDVMRWAPPVVQAKFDPDKAGTPDFVTIPWSEKSFRKPQYVPFVKPMDFSYDWELVNQGARFLDMKVTGDNRDCIGKRDGSNWVGGGKYELYTPMGPNNKQIISTIQESYCTLVAFGLVTEPAKYDCEKTARCMPGDSGCDWKKLPDALCPVSDADIDMFACHLGAKGNVNAETGYPSDADLKCTDTAPTEAQDPDKVQTRGQCCDPLGKMTGGLPACNAYRLINDYVLAAAEINDTREHKLEPLCN